MGLRTSAATIVQRAAPGWQSHPMFCPSSSAYRPRRRPAYDVRHTANDRGNGENAMRQYRRYPRFREYNPR